MTAFNRPSVDSTGAMFFTKYSEPDQLNQTDRRRFRSTFQASKLGDQSKMNEVQEMFNNYNLFKYGQYATGTKRRHSSRKLQVDLNPSKHKNIKQRTKDVDNLKDRLSQMKTYRKQLFDKLAVITTKDSRKL